MGVVVLAALFLFYRVSSDGRDRPRVPVSGPAITNTLNPSTAAVENPVVIQLPPGGNLQQQTASIDLKSGIPVRDAAVEPESAGATASLPTSETPIPQPALSYFGDSESGSGAASAPGSSRGTRSLAPTATPDARAEAAVSPDPRSPEASDPGTIGLPPELPGQDSLGIPPEASDPGTLGPAPEAGTTGDAGLPPEDR